MRLAPKNFEPPSLIIEGGSLPHGQASSRSGVSGLPPLRGSAPATPCSFCEQTHNHQTPHAPLKSRPMQNFCSLSVVCSPPSTYQEGRYLRPYLGLYALSVHQTSVLRSASLRFHLTIDTSAVRLKFPLTGHIKDFFR
jgi:hypothetical protein